MLSETASVVSSDGHSLQLKTGRQGACSGCSLKGGCGQYLLARPDALLDLQHCALEGDLQQGGVQGGDQVQISLAEGQLLLLAALFYVLPLAALLLATLLASLLGAGEGALMLTALVGLAAGVGVARRLLRSDEVRRRLSPQIRKVTGTAVSADRNDGSSS